MHIAFFYHIEVDSHHAQEHYLSICYKTGVMSNKRWATNEYRNLALCIFFKNLIERET